MAITLADFNKIWASTSPLTPYSFSESNYKQGWNFIGSTPPARQMWDFLQKNNDEKMQYLANNYLPLSGGTMSGTIITSADPSIKLSSDNSYLALDGATNYNRGAHIILSGKDRTNNNGVFNINAHDGTTSKSLKGSPNGTLTWDGNDVITSAGGTLNGDLEIVGNYHSLLFKNPNFTKGTDPSSDLTLGWVRFNDSTGAQTVGLFGYVNTSGTVYVFIRAAKNQSTLSFQQVILQNPNSGNASFEPGDDNVINLGESDLRWKQLYAGTATINTSDERLKDNIEAIPDDVLDAWGEVNWYQYQFKDSIAEKGEKARIHTGAIAQRIESVFKAHGLDAFRYGLLCYDEWEAQEEQKDENGNVVQEAREAGNRYSLRYEEALCMEAAYQRRRADRLEERIAKLEALIRTE